MWPAMAAFQAAQSLSAASCKAVSARAEGRAAASQAAWGGKAVSPSSPLSFLRCRDAALVSELHQKWRNRALNTAKTHSSITPPALNERPFSPAQNPTW